MANRCCVLHQTKVEHLFSIFQFYQLLIQRAKIVCFYHFLAFYGGLCYHSKQRCQCWNRPRQHGNLNPMLRQMAEHFHISHIGMEAIV